MSSKKIAIASGKGGVGKSMLSSALGMLFSEENKMVAVDCDVDAPNLAIWLAEIEDWDNIEKIGVSEKPVINSGKLNKEEAKRCVKKCRFGAFKLKNEKLELNPFLCEGCGACEVFCPQGVIKMKSVKNGEIKIKKTKYNFPLVSGQLYPGETGSGKIVTKLKEKAEEFDYNIMLIDSSPGTGCPIVASLQDTDFVVLITEPSLSGFSDLKRILKVVKHFEIQWGLVINKYDINSQLSDEIEKWIQHDLTEGKFLGKISYDKKIFKAVSSLTPIMETNLRVKKEIQSIFNKLIKILKIKHFN